MRSRLLPKLLLLALLPLGTFIPAQLIRADELDDVTNQLNQEKQRLADLEAKKNQLANSISSASATLAQVSTQLTEAEAELAAIEAALAEKEALLAQWESNRNLLIRDFYKKSRVSPIEVALSEDDFVGSARQFCYYRESLSLLADQIRALSSEISVFQENKTKAEQLRNDLANLKAQYQILLASRQSAYATTTTQLSQVKASIQGLTAKQEQLILAKFAATAQNETIGDKEPLSESLPEPSFTPAFMVATYGYPHRVGMNQYGAYGRALAGQTYDQILHAYYSGVTIGAYDVPATVSVQGYGDVSFEDNYLRGISEMPRSWPMEALKAQAVAARTYALNYVLKNGSICADQNCQVYNGTSDRLNCEGEDNQRWCDAVKATRGVVITYGGSPIGAWYASTAGGYTLSASEVWGGSAPWAIGIKDYGEKGAYDGPDYGNSPWYHTGWGSRNCNKSEYNPWLTKEELADIFNAVLLYQKSSDYTQYLSPVDGCIKDAGWSADQVKAKLVEFGVAPINSVSAVAVSFRSDGANTATVYATTDRGPLDFSAATFRAIFNLRAPGYLVIKTGRFDFEVR